ncbi:MAG: AraC family transcriptional regulator [Alteromonadaceae bacterium]|nr:MAG: AraC family transcriptional regulator [Alteromonadaceae bacterium]
MKTLLLLLVAISLLSSPEDASAKKQNKSAAVTRALGEVKQLSNDIQQLKGEVINLNRDLITIEEALLYPSSTRYSFFVSVSRGEFFTLESIKLKLDGKTITAHLYDEDARIALSRGGIHKLFVTNLSEGAHTVTAFFTGLGPNSTPFKRAHEVSFTKQKGQGFLEIGINDNGAIQEAIFELKHW